MAKWRIIRIIMVKGLSMRQKLQNSKGYAESPEFLPALLVFIFKKKSIATIRGKLDPYFTRLQFFVHTHTYIMYIRKLR